MADNEKQFELFEEILATSKMGGFVNWDNQNFNINHDDPSWTWRQLKCNPWLAMAVYDDIEEKDSRVGSCLETRKNAVLAKSWRMIPASDSRQDKKIAAFIEETLRDYFMSESAESDYSGFDAFMFEALDAIAKGVSVGEIIFADGRDRIYIENVKFKPQQLFAFGDTALAAYSTASLMYPQTGSLKLRQGVMLENFAGADLPEDKFFAFSYRPKHGNRWGQALLKFVFWASWMKRASVRQWLKYQEKGNGAVIAKYPGGSTAAEQDKALGAATAIVEENAVAIPDRFVVEVHELVRNLGSSHKELVDDFCNVEITLRLTGQTLTSRGSDGGGGNRALGEVHDKVRGEYTETDCKQVMIPINKRLVKPLTILNFGPNAKLPTFKIDYEPQEDVDKKVARFGQLRKDVGMPLSKKQIREECELDEPADEADTLGGETPSAPEENEDALNAKTLEFSEKNSALRQQVELEDGTLSAIAPKYDSILGRVIAEIEKQDALKLPSEAFFNSLSDDFQGIDSYLADGIFAAYLLGYDSAREENLDKVDFAEDADNRAEKAGSIDLRFDVAPEEAIDYFKRKKIISKEGFEKLSSEAKSAAFTVSGIYQDDVLKAFKKEIEDALENGSTQKTIVKKFKEILDGAGHKELGDFHLETIATTNMQIAYGVGRRRQMEDVADLLPFWEYSAVNDNRTRPTHRALDGLIYPANHEFWDTHYPPWGFNCRCTVIARVDMPDDYNHRKPNPDTTIAYDENGLPAKAEYRTQVVDLKTTKFVGVPKQSDSLQQIIEEAADDAGKVSSASIGKLKSVEEIEEWAEKKFPHIQFDFEGAAFETIQPTMKEFTTLAKQYPEVANRLEYVGTYRNKSKTLHEGGGFAKDSTAIAHATTDSGKRIGLNTKYYGDFDKMMEVSKLAEELNWTVENGIESTMTHEFGHLVDGWLNSLREKSVVDGERLDGSTTFSDVILTRWRKHKIESAKELSRYALTNELETFAESFSALRHRAKSAWCKYTKLQKRFLDDIRNFDFPTNPKPWSALSAEERAEATKKLDEIKKKFDYLD